MRRYCLETCCRNRCNLWRRKTPQTRQLWLSKTASSRLLRYCWLPRHGRVQPDWSNGGRPPVPVCFSDEMRNSRGALTPPAQSVAQTEPPALLSRGRSTVYLYHSPRREVNEQHRTLSGPTAARQPTHFQWVAEALPTP